MDPRSVVFELLERWGNKPRILISDTDLILDDLRMHGDDYGMSFIPELQKRLRFEAPRTDWETVLTVANVLRVVDRHVGGSSQTSSLE